jgi:hypothetical protein
VKEYTEVNRGKYQPNRALARRIRAARIPIPIDEGGRDTPHDPPPGLFVYLDGARTESCAFDYLGGAGYVIKLVITVNLPHFAISEFGLELPWEAHVRWLVDPVEIGGRADVYRFSPDYALEFERHEVLNQCANVELMWKIGKSCKGYLLGVGDVPIPDEFQQGEMIPAFLIVYDQFVREHRSPISLWRDGTIKPVRHGQPGNRRKGRLFDCRDSIVRR